MSDLSIAFITIFGTVASVTGVILFVFNGTRKLIKEMHQTQKEMHQTQKEMHETQKGMYETLKEMHNAQVELARQAEERHKEVIELLKRGFGEVIAEVRK